jgi:acyl-CoA thioesterase
MSAFDTATAVGEDGSAHIVPGWDIGGNANGGYLLALAARRMAAVAGRRYPLSVTGHFLRPGSAGPVRVGASVVKAGRRLSTAQGALVRDGHVMLQALGSFVDELDGPGETAIAGAPPELAPPDQCVPRTRAQGMVEVALMDRLTVMLRPGDAGFVDGRPSGRAEIAGWFAFADGRPVDPLALLLVCDCFPPAVFNLPVSPGWVPTVEYTVHIRALPEPGPLRCIFRSQFVQGGTFNEDGEVWDSSGRLVAQSRQLGLLPHVPSTPG